MADELGISSSLPGSWVFEPAPAVPATPVEVEVAPGAVEPERLQVAGEAEQGDAKPAVAPRGFVVSITRGGRHRKPHHVGSRKRLPDIDYKDYEVFGDVMPEFSLLDSLCAQCFGTTALPAEAESDVESFDSSGSSEAGAGPAAAKTQGLVMWAILSLE